MASAYFVVSNALATQISLDGGDFRQTVPASGTLNIYSNDLVGNQALCNQLSALVTAGSISVTRSGNSVTAADLTSFGFGADMLSSQFDTDNDEISDLSEGITDGTTTVTAASMIKSQQGYVSSIVEIDDTDSPFSALVSHEVISCDSTAGVIAITMPDASAMANKTIVIKDSAGTADSNNITVSQSGSGDVIDGAASLVLSQEYGSVKLLSDGVNWLSVEKTRKKVGSEVHLQAVAATDSDVAFIAPGPGRITYVAAFSGATADAAESLACDVHIGGISCLSVVATLDAAATTTVVEGTIDTAANTLAQGDVVTFERTYVAGGAPTPIVNSVISVIFELD